MNDGLDDGIRIYVLWNDYDGTYCNVFESRESACSKVAEIVAKANSTNGYGTTLHAVVEGKPLDVNVVSRIDTVELRDKEDADEDIA